jgi:hypothetical protein
MAAMHNVQQDVREQDNDPRRVLFQTVLKNLRIIFRSVQTYSRWVEKESGVSAAQLWMLWELYNEPGLTAALLKKAPRPAQGALADVLLRLPDNALADLDSGLVQLVAALQVKDKEAGMIPIDGAE